MQPSAALPPTTLLLQRQRCDGDCARWRTMLAVPLDGLLLASHLVAVAEQLDDGVRWRLASAEAGGQVYHWEDGRWVERLTMH
jgi:hypothetical protein